MKGKSSPTSFMAAVAPKAAASSDTEQAARQSCSANTGSRANGGLTRETARASNTGALEKGLRGTESAGAVTPEVKTTANSSSFAPKKSSVKRLACCVLLSVKHATHKLFFCLLCFLGSRLPSTPHFKRQQAAVAPTSGSSPQN